MTYVGLIVTFTLVNNLVLSTFLGLCPILGVTRRSSSAMTLGLATTFMMALGSLVTWLIRSVVLAPLGLGALQTLLFVLVLYALGHYVELLVERVSPALHRLAGRSIRLMATNCAVLGIVLIAARAEYTALESVVAGVAAGAGYLLVAVVLSAIREQLETEWVPRPFRGLPIAFVSAGLMALALFAFDRAFLQHLVG